jgi:hypothetical protein
MKAAPGMVTSAEVSKHKRRVLNDICQFSVKKYLTE